MAVIISSGVLDAILADARRDPVHERCGLLFGDGGRILEFAPAANVALAPERAFELDPVALLAAHRAARTGGLPVMGHYHSHPDGRAEPSSRDAAAAGADGQYWLIIAMNTWSLWQAQAGGCILGAFVPIDVVVSGAQKPLPATDSRR